MFFLVRHLKGVAMTAVVSEPSSPKRGRPPVLSPEEVAEHPELTKGAFGRRTLLNRHYAGQAAGVLILVAEMRDDMSFTWLIDPSVPKMRETILTELGRMNDGAAMYRAARHICDHQLPTREAVAYIRRVRVGKIPLGAEGDVQARATPIAEKIITAINEYRERYDLDWGDVRAALRYVDAMIERTMTAEGARHDD